MYTPGMLIKDKNIDHCFANTHIRNSTVVQDHFLRTCRSVADEQKVNQARFEQTKQHNEEDSLVARPVKTRRSLANSNGPTTGDGTSSSADFHWQTHAS